MDLLIHVPPQAPAVTPLSREQGRYSSKEKELTEEGEVQGLEDPDREQGSDSSQEQKQTEEGEQQELEEPDRRNNYQVKEKEY